MMIPEKLEECPKCGEHGDGWIYDAQACRKCDAEKPTIFGGFVFMTPDEEARIRAEERERCAAVIRNRGNLYEAAAERHQAGHPNQQKARTKAGVAFRLANEVLNHSETEYVCVRREELEALSEAAKPLFDEEEQWYEMGGTRILSHATQLSVADIRALCSNLRSLLKQKE